MPSHAWACAKVTSRVETYLGTPYAALEEGHDNHIPTHAILILFLLLYNCCEVQTENFYLFLIIPLIFLPGLTAPPVPAFTHPTKRHTRPSENSVGCSRTWLENQTLRSQEKKASGIRKIP